MLRLRLRFVSIADPNKGNSTRATETFRLVAVVNKQTKEYHLHPTNLSPDQLSAEDVALLYRARWSIELVFNELKRLHQLDVIANGEDDVVAALVLVAMLTLVVTHRPLNHMRSLAPEKISRFTSLRWAETFYAGASVLMARVLDMAGVKQDPLLPYYFMGQAIDPKANRERLLSQWVKAANSQVSNGIKKH